MGKKIKLKNIETTINSNEYISNIVDIVGKVKNITFKVQIVDINKIEFEDGIFIILKLKDDSGVLPAILIGNRDNYFKKIIQDLKINDTYLIKGNTNILNKPDDRELNFILKRINSIINIGDSYLIVKAIKKNKE